MKYEEILWWTLLEGTEGNEIRGGSGFVEL